MASKTYEQFIAYNQEARLLHGIQSLLDWDQETYMPKRGADTRARHLSLVAGLMHERRSSDELGNMIATLEKEAPEDPVEAADLRVARRDFDRAVKLPTDLVKRIAEAQSRGKTAWIEARAESDFSKFAPHLQTLMDLRREMADKLGWTTEPYDALMDEYEPGAKAAEVQAVFDALRPELVALVQATQDAPRQPDLSILKRSCPVELQKTFNEQIARAIGFDFDAGRIDISVHPFCTETSMNDVRLTTRYDEHYMPMSLFGIMHEAGHGMYEQGLPSERFGSPACASVSLGIHESQSRLWENQVGRSRPFWERFYGDLQKTFTSLADVSLDDWYFAINNVRPSLIRVEADEVTYGLHIMLRFDLERQMMQGKLAVADVPQAWNDAMQSGLGVTPPNDREGCLQDVHWSLGIFGYFPTYQLGNIFAAQFFDKARQDLGNLDDQIRRGEFAPLLGWLRENIHVHGRRFDSNELVERVTGNKVSHEPYVAALNAKFKPLYGLA